MEDTQTLSIWLPTTAWDPTIISKKIPNIQGNSYCIFYKKDRDLWKVEAEESKDRKMLNQGCTQETRGL